MSAVLETANEDTERASPYDVAVGGSPVYRPSIRAALTDRDGSAVEARQTEIL